MRQLWTQVDAVNAAPLSPETDARPSAAPNVGESERDELTWSVFEYVAGSVLPMLPDLYYAPEVLAQVLALSSRLGHPECKTLLWLHSPKAATSMFGVDVELTGLADRRWRRTRTQLR